MRYVGIDVGSDSHVVAAVTADGTVAFKPTGITEDAAGYAKLFALLGQAPVALVTMEATGHYWRNLFAALAAHGYAVALLNPLRTRRFAGEDLARTKTDSIDALGIARFGAQKCPAVTRLPDAATDELRELVRHRDRLVADFGDRVRQLHRLVDLGFPEFRRHVKSLDSMLACTLLAEYPNAQAFAGATPRRLAKLVYDGVHKVGPELAAALIAAAKVSVGHHHGPAYRIQVRHTCQDLDLLRRRIRELDDDITRQLDDYEVGSLLTSIEGIGTNTAARLIAELGDLGRFPQCRGARRLCRRGPRSQAIGQTPRPEGRPLSDRPRPPARRLVDAAARGCTSQSLAQGLLRSPDQPRQAAQGRPGRRSAQTARRRLRRRARP